ncbi:MAG: hypothetical protein M3N14_00285 [Bacteroidota bacterium]|nr:hypothetical protein [Bacteroidota bacterium]
MDNSFFVYMEQLELVAFFSGYPLIYAITLFIAGTQQEKNNIITKAGTLLPLSYALVGTLFLGFQLKKFYPDYSIASIKLSFQQPLLIIWALLSILFWLPALRKKRILSLIHSLVFFSFIVRDLFFQFSGSLADNNIIKNDMRTYSNSLLLNLGAFALMLFVSYLFYRLKKR